MITSFFSINTQFENVGDALINREMIRFAALNGNVVVDISRCPPEFAKVLDPHSKDGGSITWLRSFGQLVQQILSARIRGDECYYFLSPGGYVGERKGKQFAAGLANTGVLRAMKAGGVKVCHIGVSYERIGPWHARLLRGRKRIIWAHYARDADSAAYARSLGLRINGIMPDFAFGAYGTIPATNTPRNEIAFSFRTDQSETTREQFRTLVKWLDKTLPPELAFRFICQVERDGAFLQELRSLVPAPRRASYHDVSGDIDECMRHYDACLHIISNRLHALLIGLIRGARPVPLVDVVHNQKIIGIFEDLDPSITPIDTAAPEWQQAVLTMLDTGAVDSDVVAAKQQALAEAVRQIYGSYHQKGSHAGSRPDCL